MLACSYAVSDGPFSRDSVANVVAGFCGQPMESEYVSDPHAYLLGDLAQELMRWRKGVPDTLEIRGLINAIRIDPSKFTAFVRELINADTKVEAS